MALTGQLVLTVAKPPEFKEVEELMSKHNISFKEKGVRSGQVQPLADWSAYIDREIKKLSRKKDNIEKGKGDANEILDMIDDFEGYKTAKTTEKRSINMCSTRTGNELNITFYGVSTSPDEQYKQLVIIDYVKSVDVLDRARHGEAGGGTKTMKALASLGIWNLVNHVQDENAAAEEAELRKKLANEHIAKYMLVNAFKASLEADGVKVQITDA